MVKVALILCIGLVVLSVVVVAWLALIKVTPSHIASAAREVVILLGGLNTSLSNCQLLDFESHHKFAPLVNQLVRVYGFDDPYSAGCNRDISESSTSQLDLAEFSYKSQSGEMHSGHWFPVDYSRCQPNSNSLEQDSKALSDLLDKYRSVYPNTRFELIGHSLGGLVALKGGYDYATTHESQPGIITKIVTIDSPLHGYKADVLDPSVVQKLQAVPGSCRDDLVVNPNTPLAQELQSLAKDDTSVQNMVKRFAEFGTSVYTFGNTQDCLYYFGECLPNSSLARNQESTQFIAGSFQQPLHLGSEGMFPGGHEALLVDLGAIQQLAYILAAAPSVTIFVTKSSTTDPTSLVIHVRVYFVSSSGGTMKTSNISITARGQLAGVPILQHVTTFNADDRTKFAILDIPFHLVGISHGTVEFSVDFVTEGPLLTHHMQDSVSATSRYADLNPTEPVAVGDYFGQTTYNYT